MTGQQEYRITDALEAVKELQAYPLNSHEIICLNIIKEALCSLPVHEQQYPIPNDEQCRICQIATRKDEREQWKVGVLKFTEEDPLLMAYADGYKAGRKDTTGKVLEQLDDLRKYANGEYQEAECSDNEREMRIHLEYENRIWGIMKELRKGEQE
jgi:hypothetical protein